MFTCPITIYVAKLVVAYFMIIVLCKNRYRFFVFFFSYFALVNSYEAAIANYLRFLHVHKEFCTVYQSHITVMNTT